MTDAPFTLLPEGVPFSAFVDDPEFTEVTRFGEVYTLFRIVRITHQLNNNPGGWTHIANVTRVREPALGVAHLRIVDRVIVDAKVTLTPVGD